MAVMTYKEGSKGTIVKQIQKAVGCYPDGIWGKVTTEAVKTFQREHGLQADGIAGPKTLALLLPELMIPTDHSCGEEVMNGRLKLRKSRRRIDEIIIHCTATPEGSVRTVEDIRKQHKAQGWSDIGYHYLIYLDGTVHEGRSVDIVGAHANGHNSHSIGVCYVGGLENRPNVPYNRLKAKDTRTPAQKMALVSLLVDLRKLYPKARIIGHRDLSPDLNGNGIADPSEWIKECPAFDAKTEYHRI